MNNKYLLKSYYWEKLTISKLRFFTFKKLVTMSVFEEVHLTQISLNFKTSCWRTLCFSSYKNRKLKVKLWWVRARERKKRAFFVPFILSKEIFCNIYVLSHCIVYWIHSKNTHTFTYQKTLFHTLLLLVFKTVDSLQCILKLSLWVSGRWVGKLVFRGFNKTLLLCVDFIASFSQNLWLQEKLLLDYTNVFTHIDYKK